LTRYEAEQLTDTRVKADYYERIISNVDNRDGEGFGRYAKQAANWMLGDFARLLNASDMEITNARITPESLYAMIALVEEGTITSRIAKSVFEVMFNTGKAPADLVRDLGLEQISGSGEIEAIVEQVIGANPKPVEDFRAGKQEAIKFLVGQAMRQTRGRANPATLTEILKAKLEAKA